MTGRACACPSAGSARPLPGGRENRAGGRSDTGSRRGNQSRRPGEGRRGSGGEAEPRSVAGDGGRRARPVCAAAGRAGGRGAGGQGPVWAVPRVGSAVCEPELPAAAFGAGGGPGLCTCFGGARCLPTGCGGGRWRAAGKALVLGAGAVVRPECGGDEVTGRWALSGRLQWGRGKKLKAALPCRLQLAVPANPVGMFLPWFVASQRERVILMDWMQLEKSVCVLFCVL